jgi:hypothetical protein
LDDFIDVGDSFLVLDFGDDLNVRTCARGSFCARGYNPLLGVGGCEEIADFLYISSISDKGCSDIVDSVFYSEQ